MSYTRRQFCLDWLRAIGNSNPSQPVLNFVIGWSVEESGHTIGPGYNLWNTTYRMPGSTTFNSVGVQRYASYADGITANTKTIKQPGLYTSLLQALQSNDAASLGMTGSMSSGVLGDLNVWVHGYRSPIDYSYSTNILALARNASQWGNEIAPGDATGITGGVPSLSSVIASTGTDIHYPSGQCTWYASFRYHQLTGKWVMPTWGDAHSWSANAAKDGWIVSTKPMLPSIICLQANVQGAGSLGHVAIVDSINLDGSVSTSGLNWAGNQSTPTKVTFRPGGGVTFIAYPGIGNNASGSSNTPSSNPIDTAIAAVTQFLDITTVSAQANAIVNTIPGFLGVCEAVDKVEQFVPFQLPANASAAVGNTGIPGVTTQTGTIDIFGWNIDVPTGFSIASPQQIAQLPADAIQAVLVFTTTNFLAFAVRSIIVLAGIILFTALVINVISSIVNVDDAQNIANAVESVGMLAA